MKKMVQSILAVLLFWFTHTVLCVAYNYTYFSTEFHFEERFQGLLYWVMLMAAFLTAPLFYYITGRICNKKGNKKAVLGVLLVCNVAVSVLGVASFFSENLLDVYMHLNAPSYLYYSLFSDTVMYLAVPAMVISSMFPVFFFKIGYLNKPRTNNEIKMEDIEKTGSSTF